MQGPPAIENEAERMASLTSLQLDRTRVTRYSELAELAAFISHTPMSSISVIEDDEVWFKASVGFDADAVSRSSSICAGARGLRGSRAHSSG